MNLHGGHRRGVSVHVETLDTTDMKWGLFIFFLIHGFIHFMGFAKAFGFVELPQLNQPVTKGMGLVWLVAGLLVLLAAVLFVYAPRVWWMVGFAAVLFSQVAIISSWYDARFGTLVNVIMLIGVIYGFAAQGPLSFNREYMDEVQKHLEMPVSHRLVEEDDLQPLPVLLQRYLRKAGAVGQPFIHHFKATWQGRIRATKDDPWMTFTAEQHNFIDDPKRFFIMKAKKGGLPVDVLHVFQDGSAAMRVRLLSLFTMVNASGPELTRAETVTLFNDLCLLAPSVLIDSAITWTLIDEQSIRGYYTVGSNTISAVLVFNENDELVDFISDDRLVALPDGSGFAKQRWSTPVKNYKHFGQRYALTFGEGRWYPKEGEFAYIELELLDLQINNNK
ncbi:MAG: DUF6544 family protein [Rhodothermales bacterium]